MARTSCIAVPEDEIKPLFDSDTVAAIRKVLRHAHELIVDASLPGGTVHVPDSVIPALDAIADAMREVTALGN